MGKKNGTDKKGRKLEISNHQLRILRVFYQLMEELKIQEELNHIRIETYDSQEHREDLLNQGREYLADMDEDPELRVEEIYGMIRLSNEEKKKLDEQAEIIKKNPKDARFFNLVPSIYKDGRYERAYICSVKRADGWMPIFLESWHFAKDEAQLCGKEPLYIREFRIGKDFSLESISEKRMV